MVSKKVSQVALAALLSAGIMTASAAFAGEHKNECKGGDKAAHDANKCKGEDAKKDANKCSGEAKKEGNTCKGEADKH